MASAVIEHNTERKDKRLWTDRKGGAKVIYFRGNDELEEADFITRTAHAGISGEPGKCPWKNSSLTVTFLTATRRRPGSCSVIASTSIDGYR